jgi:hypothetical protein
MDPRLVTPYLITALVLWALYRRLRRSFGRQRVREPLMWLRIGILTAVAVLATVGMTHDIRLLAALIAGVAGGAALGYVGLRYTRFEVTADGRFYTPHAYIGVAVTVLFVGRLLYRFLAVYDGTLPAAAAGSGFAAAYQGSPFTLAVFGALVGYYVLYYLGVLQRTRIASAIAVSK